MYFKTGIKESYLPAVLIMSQEHIRKNMINNIN
jgi:hypothetical protein